MAYLQFDDYYRALLISGKLPMPYPIQNPFVHSAPNLANDNCHCNQINLQLGSWGPPENDYYLFNYFSDYLTDGSCDLYGPSVPFQDPSCALGFFTTNLVSNLPGCARNTDPNLLDPWGIIVINGIIYVANTGTGLVSMYNLMGGLVSAIKIFGPFCTIGQPTGIVYNCNQSGFLLFKGPICEPATIIVCTRDGTINGYNCQIDECKSAIMLDNSLKNSVYTGLELVNGILYVVDFYNQKINTYDYAMNPVIMGPFQDSDIPCDFAPYNIINIGDVLYVSYAKQSPIDNQFEICGCGFGFINIFMLDGVLLKRFASGGSLNAPWGMALAPSVYGYPAGSIMVSNFGDNSVSVYDPSGLFISKIRDKSGNDIYIEKVKGLYVNPCIDRFIYWTSRDNNLRDACVGTINIGNC